MRHLKAKHRLGRNATHRLAMFRNMSRSLFLHGRIITTVPKAKALRPFVEKLITLAKKGTLHHRRLAISRLHDAEVVKRLFDEIAPRYKDRPGGYTRIIKRAERRLGDAGVTCYIELLREGETKAHTKAERPAAPKVEAPRVEQPAPAPAPAPTPEQQQTPPAEKPPENPPAQS